ncbi:MAG: 50S ribosomal protein L24e [Candidatus Diapherotrites archaeon]|nr:50S ribosomal protein L24e [Candidatus Diapherotrites archaeon]
MQCSFCKDKIVEGTGKIMVTKAGRILCFCSKKCEKNMIMLSRNPSKLKWVNKQK